MSKLQWRALTAVAGAAAHLLLFFFLVNGDDRMDSWYCIESSCWSLVAFDFPVSLLFIGGDHTTVTCGSLTAGTLWWGALALGAYSSITSVLKRRRIDPPNRKA